MEVSLKSANLTEQSKFGYGSRSEGGNN